MPNRRSLLRRLKLRTVLVVALLLSGIIPLGVSSYVLFREAREVLANSERDNLTTEAKALSEEVDSFLTGVRHQLSQFGTSLLLAPGPDDVTARLQEPWVEQQLQSFHRGNPDLLAIRVLALNSQGPESRKSRSRGPGSHGRDLRKGEGRQGLRLRFRGPGAEA